MRCLAGGKKHKRKGSTSPRDLSGAANCSTVARGTKRVALGGWVLRNGGCPVENRVREKWVSGGGGLVPPPLFGQL